MAPDEKTTGAENSKTHPIFSEQFRARSRSVVIRTPDGVDINVRMWNGGQPRVVLIHGFGDGSFVWSVFVRLFGEQPAMLAVDLRGHGDSSWDPSGRYSVDTHARDVSHVMARLNLRDVILIGHSLGAAVAAAIAATQPEHVAAMVLVDGGPQLRPSAVEQMFREFCEQQWHYETASQYRSLLTERRPLASETALDEYAAGALRQCDAQGFKLKCDPALKVLSGLMEPTTVWSRLSEYQRPILVIRGQVSAFLSQGAAASFVSYLRDGRLASVPMAGHAVMLDNPEKLHAAISEFLDSNATRKRWR
jgi:pimeloyl-ACP methyl ester carboxylesterase